MRRGMAEQDHRPDPEGPRLPRLFRRGPEGPLSRSRSAAAAAHGRHLPEAAA